jgi:hypothetical protein
MLKVENSKVRVEIDAQLLADLFAQRVLCAADLRCLDTLSKHQVRQLCLQSCAENLCQKGLQSSKQEPNLGGNEIEIYYHLVSKEFNHANDTNCRHRQFPAASC